MWVVLTALAAALITFYFSNSKHADAVRLSSATSLLFYFVFWCVADESAANYFSAVFFGGTFIGMSRLSRISYTGVIAASILFGWLFMVLLPLLKGVGGALGVTAFVCVSIVSLITYLLRLSSGHTGESQR